MGVSDCSLSQGTVQYPIKI